MIVRTAFGLHCRKERDRSAPFRPSRSPAFPTDAGAEIADFDLMNYALPKIRKPLKKSQKYMARDIQLAVAAAQLAVKDAGLADGGVDPTRIGIDLGAGLISSELDEIAPAIEHASSNGEPFDYQMWGRESIRMIEPIWLLKYLPNMLACHISILIDCQGPSNTITEADASSNLAIAEAARIIARGRADVMITGGADSKIHPLSRCPHGVAREHVALERRAFAGLPAVRPPSRRLGPRRRGRHLDPRGRTTRQEPWRQDLR